MSDTTESALSDDRLRNSLVIQMEQCRALLRTGYNPTFWTTRYIELAMLHNHLFPAPKHRVKIVP